MTSSVERTSSLYEAVERTDLEGMHTFDYFTNLYFSFLNRNYGVVMVSLFFLAVILWLLPILDQLWGSSGVCFCNNFDTLKQCELTSSWYNNNIIIIERLSIIIILLLFHDDVHESSAICAFTIDSACSAVTQYDLGSLSLTVMPKGNLPWPAYTCIWSVIFSGEKLSEFSHLHHDDMMNRIVFNSFSQLI